MWEPVRCQRLSKKRDKQAGGYSPISEPGDCCRHTVQHTSLCLSPEAVRGCSVWLPPALAGSVPETARHRSSPNHTHIFPKMKYPYKCVLRHLQEKFLSSVFSSIAYPKTLTEPYKQKRAAYPRPCESVPLCVDI